MSLNQFLRSVKILHMAIIFGACWVFIALYFFIGTQPDSTLPFPESFLVVLALIPWFGSRVIYRSKVMQAAQEAHVSDKLTAYRSALIVALAIAEGITLMSIVIYFFLFQATTLLFVIAVGMVSMLLLMPSKKRIISELNLSDQDLKQLEI